ncbi:GH116 family glycosyl hydrolase [Sulfurisphaera ohwakuensis]|uniref:Beta-glucosidase n=1 Tax=Sulfurisphaera ohwakuensis TaxID=69656 RepID=A0A650CJY1_SULOH|nr:GH116 family glycosyl hydrolase [Sulfurisphaera ohwakuensis]MBB5254516.1 uncharacterized protein (DUF608 family) [Sulfurisphaera ohwakuensis]QGR18126.1 beta-glucosidase [Sulfurisphaera ohwakuensis]
MKYSYYYALDSGVVLGGIGTGSIEIRADGRFYDWTIFNNGSYAERQEIRRVYYLTQNDFFTGIRYGNKVRILQAYDYYFGASPYYTPWLRPIKSLEYIGEPPFAFLNFKDDFEVRLKAFSPFIPHDLKNSSLPVAIFEYEVDKDSDFIVGIKNPFESGRIEFKRDTLVFSGEVTSKDPRYGGNLCIKVVGSPWLAKADNFPLFKEWNEFREKGYISTSQGDKWGFIGNRNKKFIVILGWYFPNHLTANGKKIGHYYENFFNNCLDVVNYAEENLIYLEKMTNEFHDALYNTRGVEDWIADLVGSQLTTLIKSTWLSKDGNFYIWEGYYQTSDERKVGEHPYTDGPVNTALNTIDVSTYFIYTLTVLYPQLAKNLLLTSSRSALSYDNPLYIFYSLAMPENRSKYVERVIKDPSIPSSIEKLLQTVKEIAKETGKDPKGRIAHYIYRDLKFDEYGRNDLNPEFVLMWGLVSKYTGDIEFMKSLYPVAKEAMESVLRTHFYEGLIYSRLPSGFEWNRQVFSYFKDVNIYDNLFLVVSLLGIDSFHMSVNTFDDWTTVGINSFVSLLGISALKILNELGGDKYNVENALSLYESMLWNGEYFDLWYDPISGYRDKTCQASQLLGEFYLNLLGYSLLDKEKTRKTLLSIVKYNLKEEEGVINGAYPDGYRPLMREYENPLKIKEASIHQDTPWSGVEFYLASHLIYEKMIDEAKKVLKEVYDRYSIAGNFWNHWEWGSHYSRPLSSWLIIPAYLGLIYDGINRVLTLDPAIEELSWIIVLPDFWGRINVNKGKAEIKIIEGKAVLKKIDIKGKKIIRIVADGKVVDGDIIAEKEIIVEYE